MSQRFCLKWNNHKNHGMDVFNILLSTETMVDVTLACDGQSLKAHKMVLAACSPFFQSLFSENPCQHPIVILTDTKYSELKAIIEFMYHGEVNVALDQLSAFLKTAEALRVKGLAAMTIEKDPRSSNSAQDKPTRMSVPISDLSNNSAQDKPTRKSVPRTDLSNNSAQHVSVPMSDLSNNSAQDEPTYVFAPRNDMSNNSAHHQPTHVSVPINDPSNNCRREDNGCEEKELNISDDQGELNSLVENIGSSSGADALTFHEKIDILPASQKRMLLYLVQNVDESDLNGGPVPFEALASVALIQIASARTYVNNLKEGGLIEIEVDPSGNGSPSYKVPRHTFDAVVKNKNMSWEVLYRDETWRIFNYRPPRLFE